MLIVVRLIYVCQCNDSQDEQRLNIKLLWYLFCTRLVKDLCEEFEDIKEVIRIRKSKRNSQHNGQKTKDKKIYSVFQRTKSSMYTFFTLIHHLPLCVHDCDFVVILIHEWFRASNYVKASLYLVKPLLNEYLIKHQENKTGSKSRYFKWVWWL